MKKDTGLLTAVFVSFALILAGNFAYKSKTNTTVKPPEPKQKLVDSLKIDSIIIKIYKE